MQAVCLGHRVQVGEVAQTCLHAKMLQGGGYQGQRVAEEMARRDDVLALLRDGQQGVADGRHARVEGSHVGCSRQRLDALFEVGHRGVLHTGVVGGFDAVREGVGHLGGIIELKRYIVIQRYGQSSVNIWPYKWGIYCNCLFLHPYQFFYLLTFTFLLFYPFVLFAFLRCRTPRSPPVPLAERTWLPRGRC